jgi:hypothetical protein
MTGYKKVRKWVPTTFLYPVLSVITIKILITPTPTTTIIE